jgi:hypothetical protein
MDWGVWGGGTTSSTLHEGMQLHKDWGVYLQHLISICAM